MSTCPSSPGRFERPHFVTPHAVQQFRQRICDLPPGPVISVVQSLLQHPGLPVDAEVRGGKLTLIYGTTWRGRAVYLPVIPGETEKGDWPCVPTVMGSGAQLHYVLRHDYSYRQQHGRFPMRYWRDELTPIARALHDAGFSYRKIGKIMRRGHTTAWRALTGQLRKRQDVWSEEQLVTALTMRQQKCTIPDIARVLSCSPKRVEHRLYHYRKQVFADPGKRRVLRLMTRVLKAIKKEGLHCPESE